MQVNWMTIQLLNVDLTNPAEAWQYYFQEIEEDGERKKFSRQSKGKGQGIRGSNK